MDTHSAPLVVKVHQSCGPTSSGWLDVGQLYLSRKVGVCMLLRIRERKHRWLLCLSIEECPKLDS